MKRLEKRNAIVTGGASGLGEAIAARLLEEGAQVIITDIQVSLGRATAERRGFHFLEQDVTDEGRWTSLVDEVEKLHGKVHILVNNAGVLGPMQSVDPETTTLSDWRQIFRINVEGVFLGCRAAVQAMRRAGGGSIVNLSSAAGLVATPYATAYGASKAAVRQLTKSVAQHCAQHRLNIRCNSVHPGNVRTPLWDHQAREVAAKRGVSLADVVAEAEAICPLGDLTTPQDVAAAVAFLVSDDARHVTGSKMLVDGGIVECETFLLGKGSARREAQGN
jgi:3(or 17)beta-hydroxysteroid dehydrogenase